MFHTFWVFFWSSLTLRSKLWLMTLRCKQTCCSLCSTTQNNEHAFTVLMFLHVCLCSFLGFFSRTEVSLPVLLPAFPADICKPDNSPKNYRVALWSVRLKFDVLVAAHTCWFISWLDWELATWDISMVIIVCADFCKFAIKRCRCSSSSECVSTLLRGRRLVSDIAAVGTPREVGTRHGGQLAVCTNVTPAVSGIVTSVN